MPEETGNDDDEELKPDVDPVLAKIFGSNKDKTSTIGMTQLAEVFGVDIIIPRKWIVRDKHGEVLYTVEKETLTKPQLNVLQEDLEKLGKLKEKEAKKNL